MHIVLVIALREVLTLLRKPSFWITAVAGPLIAGAIIVGYGFLNREIGDQSIPSVRASGTLPTGYIDRANVVRTVPSVLRSRVRAFSGEEAAAGAVRAGTIGSYFVIAPDYRQSGRVTRVSQQATFASGTAADTRIITLLLRTNLSGDPQIAQRLEEPFNPKMEVVSAGQEQTTRRQPLDALGTGLAVLLAFSIVNGGGRLVQAVAEEKENRTIEVILTSVQPWKLMAGKLFGLGLVSFLQFIAWTVIARGLLGGDSSPLGTLQLGAVPPMVWFWLVIYFVLGFLFFGGIMLMLGTVGASMRESGQISGLMTLPAVAPLWFAAPIAENPDGTLARVLSLFPLTAPVTMMLRMGAMTVPLWQLLVSVFLLVLGLIASIGLAARLFRSTNLLTGARPTPRAIWRALRAT